MSKEQTWPFSVVRPGDLPPETADIGFNVRGPDGLVVFTRPVEPWVAEQACAALNRQWDEVS